MKILTSLSCAMLLLAGCMAGPKLAPIDAHHPASPDAPEATMPEAGAMLRDEDAPLPQAQSSPSPHHEYGMHGGSEGAKSPGAAGGHAHHHGGGDAAVEETR
jgi:hypothetical protein